MVTDEVLIIVEVQDVLDEPIFASYRAQARQQLLEHGGELLAQGGDLFEGSPAVGRSVLVQRWPSEHAFRTWQASEAYAPLLRLRNKAARLRISIVPTVS